MSSRNQDHVEQLIPLNRLKKSPRNVRRVPHAKAHIEALASNITAQGQIQNLVVETEKDEGGKPTGSYLVNVGEGRRLAQLLRVKRKQIKATEPIRCIVDDTHDAQSLSLAENDIRASMHPADQFDAFKQLIDSGLSAEAVAAQFGVSPLIVTRRLKLANVAPEFLDLYRKEKIDLEHLMALAVTDDHDRQRNVWEGLPDYRRTPDGLRDALTENEIPVSASLVKFVGLKRYEKAGGAVRRDLFSDQADDGYVMDSELLWKLATQKLEQRAAKLKEEGCAWVDIMPQWDYSALSAFGRVRPILREATEDERTELDRLNLQLAAIQKQIEDAGEDEEQAEALQQQEEDISGKIDAIEDAMRVPDPAQRAVAGAVVSMDRSGEWRIETGLLRPEDARKFQRAERVSAKATPDVPRLHSAALVRRLTAHRTLALCATVAQRPDVALLALAHRLVVVTFYDGDYEGRAEVQIDVRRTNLDQYGEDVAGSKAHRAMAELAEGWRVRLPSACAGLFDWLAQQSQADVLSLCAYCVATTLNDVSADESGGGLDAIGKAAGLDMREWWSATADGYLKSVPKARILEALTEAGVTPSGALGQLKKADLALLAERRLVGTGWLPAVLRGAVV